MISPEIFKRILSSQVWNEYECGQISQTVCFQRAAQAFSVSVDEVAEAFGLFTGSSSSGGGGDGTETLTIAHLRRVAMTLKQDVPEDLLRDMILEANRGAGVGRGVTRREFEDVMTRAGVWK